MKILNLEIENKSDGAVGETIPKWKYILITNNKKRYELNRFYGDSPVVEAWDLNTGNYCLVSISEIIEIKNEGARQ